MGESSDMVEKLAETGNGPDYCEGVADPPLCDGTAGLDDAAEG